MVYNDLIAGANEFDKAKVKADADGYQLSGGVQKIDVEAISAALWSGTCGRGWAQLPSPLGRGWGRGQRHALGRRTPHSAGPAGRLPSPPKGERVRP